MFELKAWSVMMTIILALTITGILPLGLCAVLLAVALFWMHHELDVTRYMSLTNDDRDSTWIVGFGVAVMGYVAIAVIIGMMMYRVEVSLWMGVLPITLMVRGVVDLVKGWSLRAEIKQEYKQEESGC